MVVASKCYPDRFIHQIERTGFAGDKRWRAPGNLSMKAAGGCIRPPPGHPTLLHVRYLHHQPRLFQIDGLNQQSVGAVRERSDREAVMRDDAGFVRDVGAMRSLIFRGIAVTPTD
jgi:hypothetical protein